MKEFFADVAGLSVRYWEEGEGFPLIILHGWGGSSASWKAVQGAIASRGHRVIVPDLPGFGKSAPPSFVWGTDEFSRFVLTFAREIGLREFALLGHSFGGQVAVCTAARSKEVSKVILVGAAVVRPRPGAKEYALKLLSLVFHTVFFFLPLAKLKENLRVVVYRVLRRPDYFKARGIMREIMKKVITEDKRECLPDIRIPVLILWGRHDLLTPLREAKQIEKLLPSSNLVVFPGAGHNLHYETPDRLVREVVSFLS